MPYWSIGEWRARIGSSWCALGRPFKTRSPFRSRAGKMRRALTLNQAVATIFLLLMSIGVNLGLHALVARGYHQPLLSLFKGGTVPEKTYLINLGFILTLILQITSALVYQLLSMATRSSNGFSGDLTDSLSFRTCFVHYSIFLILKMINPSMFPIHWLTLTVIHTVDCVRALTVLWKTLADKQVEKLHYGDAEVEVVIMTKREGAWVLAVAKAMLDVVLSVAASVILSLLLLSGDVEENPGPVGDINYETIDTTELDEDDLSKIIDEIHTIQSRYYNLGRSLNLKIQDLRKIRDNNPRESDALEDVLLLWLEQKYNVAKHGPPTWRMLVEAASNKSGGDDHELANKIASNHPAVATAGARTQCISEESACSSLETALLSIENLKEILDLTWKYRARWRFIGIELGIDEGTLDAINENNRKVEDCLREMITFWLRNEKPKPSRHAISTALHSGRVSSTVDYTAYLKSLYKAKTQVCTIDDDQWPPPVMNRVFHLAMIMAEHVERRNITNDFVRKTITGKVDDILRKKVPVELEDIFKKIKEGQRRKILIEGAPGCGKSTLALHICQQWADGKLFQEYRQIVLVRIREQAVQNAKNIADILPQRNKTMGCEMEEELTACNGKEVLFVLDGWDELPKTAPGRLIISKMLDNTHLRDSSVIITSRPTSSASLHHIVNSRIEILGFTKNELKQYFAECLENNIKNVETLQQRIQENPVVAGSCYLPLNASILVHLFKFSKELPNTQFGIFSALIRNCMFRHLRKSTQSDKVSRIKSLDDLPQIIEAPFKNVCRVAYEGVIKDRIIFDLDRDFNTCGLLQGVESFTDCGTSHSYNFLHLSIQELLTAVHMATQLTPSEQEAQFRELFGRARFSAVFQFYAAKTKLQTPGIQNVVVDAIKIYLDDRTITELTPHSDTDSDSDSNSSDSSSNKEPQPLILSLIHCIYEAQDKALCELVVKQFKDSKLSLRGISLNPADCLAVGYFLTYCSQFKVDLGGCSIGGDGCKTLFRKGAVYDLQSLNLAVNAIGDEGAKALSEAMKTMTNLQKLNLVGNAIGDEGAKALSEAMKTMTTLQKLYLDDNAIGDEGAKALSEAMKTMTNLQELYLGLNAIGAEGAKALSEAMKTMTNLRELHLPDNPIGAEGAKALSEAMKTMTNLQELRLMYNSIGVVGREALREAAKETGTEIDW